MPNCVSENCRKPVDERWYFCPYCGVDNRPPESRHEVADHHHEFYGEEPYCLWCGGVQGIPGSGKRQRILACLSLLGGILGLALFFDFVWAGFTGTGLYGSQIHALFREHYGSYRHRSSWGSTIAMSLLVFALALIYQFFAVFNPRAARAARTTVSDGRRFW